MTLATQDLEYTDDGTTLDGVVVLDEGRSDQRPGLLLIHGGAGLDDHARGQAHRYAELGYVVLACDMYGRGIAGDRERVAHDCGIVDDIELAFMTKEQEMPMGYGTSLFDLGFHFALRVAAESRLGPRIADDCVGIAISEAGRMAFIPMHVSHHRRHGWHLDVNIDGRNGRDHHLKGVPRFSGRKGRRRHSLRRPVRVWRSRRGRCFRRWRCRRRLPGV